MFFAVSEKTAPVRAQWTATVWLVPQDICLLRTNRSSGHWPRTGLPYVPRSLVPMRPCAHAPMRLYDRAGLRRSRPSAAGRSAPVHAVPPALHESFRKSVNATSTFSQSALRIAGHSFGARRSVFHE